MARFTKESLDELRTRIDLSEVLGQHMELKRAGAAFKALCPFHDEKTPSFTLQKGDSHYHCFGCGAHGDAIQFLMQHLRMGFSEAVEHLADRFQVRLQTVTGGDDEKRVGRTRLKEALEYACRFYEFLLLYTEEGKEALQYLFDRGLTLDFIHTFRLGLAPKHDGLLGKLMRQSGFSQEALEEAGLLSNRGGGSRLKEFFLERITFPIQDAAGSVIGFSARKIREEVFGGKYINTVETQLFKKSKVLFGLHQSRKRITKERQAIIVEGQLDALRLIFHGFDFTVAGLGTAFGEAHVRELVQLGVRSVFLLFDGDEAGRTASVKVGHLFQKEGLEVRVAPLIDGVDPDLILLKHGPVGIVKALSAAEDYLLFLFRHLSRNCRLDSPAEKNELLQDMTSRIREWDNPIMIHESLKRLAHLAKVPEELVGVGAREMRSMPFRQPVTHGSGNGKATIDPDRILEADLLRWLILCSEPGFIELCRANLRVESFLHEQARTVYREILKSEQEGRRFDLFMLAQEADNEELGLFLSEIVSRKVNREKAKELIAETILRMKERNWMIEREQIKLTIHSGTANEVEVLELVRKFDALKRIVPKVVPV